MKVLLGMSGGVDSSVSAVLLKEAGYEVIGATMKLWEPKQDSKTGSCCASTAIEDAKKVCDMIGIPHMVMDCKEEFQTHVISDFISCYENAKTPNPCIECNQYLKFGSFYQKAIELGCDYVSTGHYANIEYRKEYGGYVLCKSQADRKDQTYFLYRIPKGVLEKMIFPLKDFTDKSEIRKIAKQKNLPIAEKPDSQEVCFIPDNNYGAFLQENSDQKPKIGNVVLQDGTVLGKHKGLVFYTVGQRKGLGIAYQEPLYVIQLDTIKNEVVVGKEEDLYTKELYANQLNFLINLDWSKKVEVKAKVRYRSKEAKAMVEKIEEDKIKVTFEEPQRAVTPGQSVVLYKEDVVLGGGKIL